MRTILVGLMVWGAAASAETLTPTPLPTTTSPSRVYYPGQNGTTPTVPASPSSFNDQVFDLPETRDVNPETSKYVNGRPLTDQSPLYSSKIEDIKKECQPFRDAGNMTEYRKCFQDKQDQAIADVRNSFERNSRSKEQPLRKTNTSNPVIDEQRKANAAFEADEKD